LKPVKKNSRLINRYSVYLLLGFIFVCLILTAVFMPQIVYGIYDDYQFNLSSKADKNLSDVTRFDDIYEADCPERLAAYAGGLKTGKKYITMETDIVYDEEDGTIMDLVMAMHEQLFKTNMYEGEEEIVVDKSMNEVVAAYGYTLGDIVPLSGELSQMDSYYMYSCVDRDSCRKFVIYDESMNLGIAFSLLYFTIDLGSGFEIELLGDTYDSTIYYIKFTYPMFYIEKHDAVSYDKFYDMNVFGEIMSFYYSADMISSAIQFAEDRYSASYSDILCFDGSDLNCELKIWYMDETKTGKKIGFGIREIAEAVGVMDI